MRTTEVVFSYVPSTPQGIDRHGRAKVANEPSAVGALPNLIIFVRLHMDAGRGPEWVDLRDSVG